MPRHSMRTTPASVTNRGNRDRMRKWIMALEGGRRAFVDFQVTPPLRSSMACGRKPQGGQNFDQPSRRRRPPDNTTAQNLDGGVLPSVSDPLEKRRNCVDGRRLIVSWK